MWEGGIIRANSEAVSSVGVNAMAMSTGGISRRNARMATDLPAPERPTYSTLRCGLSIVAGSNLWMRIAPLPLHAGTISRGTRACRSNLAGTSMAECEHWTVPSILVTTARARATSEALAHASATYNTRTMALEVSRHLCDGITIIRLALPDRRGGRELAEQWLFLRHVEAALYGGAGGSGAVNKLLARCVPSASALSPTGCTRSAAAKARARAHS